MLDVTFTVRSSRSLSIYWNRQIFRYTQDLFSKHLCVELLLILEHSSITITVTSLCPWAGIPLQTCTWWKERVWRKEPSNSKHWALRLLVMLHTVTEACLTLHTVMEWDNQDREEDRKTSRMNSFPWGSRVGLGSQRYPGSPLCYQSFCYPPWRPLGGSKCSSLGTPLNKPIRNSQDTEKKFSSLPVVSCCWLGGISREGISLSLGKQSSQYGHGQWRRSLMHRIKVINFKLQQPQVKIVNPLFRISSESMEKGLYFHLFFALDYLNRICFFNFFIFKVLIFYIES